MMDDNSSQAYQQKLQEASQIWDSAAASFDDQPDHGLRDPLVLSAWTELLRDFLPASKSDILDIGCGTGSLSLVLAKLGHTVTGIDFSPDMIALAEAKAKEAQQSIKFHIMDGAFPEFPSQQFDVVLCRHVLWALPDPKQVLQRWIALLKPEGHLILIEGFWHTGAGLHAKNIVEMMPASMTDVSVRDLSKQASFWGGEVADERYVVCAIVKS